MVWEVEEAEGASVRWLGVARCGGILMVWEGYV